jgi:hypothetical protein
MDLVEEGVEKKELRLVEYRQNLNSIFEIFSKRNNTRNPYYLGELVLFQYCLLIIWLIDSYPSFVEALQANHSSP